jgi:hypothetical protein
MKANELRIGSIISINGENVIVDHIKCNEDSVTVKDGFIIVFNGGDLETDGNDNIKPIPLTPSILEAAGFELINSFHPTYYFSQSDAVLELLLSPDEKTWMTKIYNNYSELSTRFVLIKNTYYLHELQNLYFSLTGTELEIDIEKLR